MRREGDAQRPKPTVLRSASARRPCRTSTSALSAPASLAQLTTSCLRPRPTTGCERATARSSRHGSHRRSVVSPAIATARASARKPTRYLFPNQPCQAVSCKCRRRLADSSQWLTGGVASSAPGCQDKLLAVVDSTPVPWRGQRRDRSARLSPNSPTAATAPPTHGASGVSPARSARAGRHPTVGITLASPECDEGEVGRDLLACFARHGGELLVCDKGCPGAWFAEAARALDVTVMRPRAGKNSVAAPAWRPSASVSSRCSGRLGIYSLRRATALAPWCRRHCAGQTVLCLTACISPNHHQLDQPSSALLDHRACSCVRGINHLGSRGEP